MYWWCISRSTCRFGRVSELTTRSTTLPLSPITGSSFEQRGYKKVHWRERGLNTFVESSQLVLVRSVSSLEQNGILVTPPVRTTTIRVDSQDRCCNLQEFHCWLNKREVERFGEQANWRATLDGESSVNKLAGVFPSQNTTVQEVGATSSDVAEPATDSTEIYSPHGRFCWSATAMTTATLQPSHSLHVVRIAHKFRHGPVRYLRQPHAGNNKDAALARGIWGANGLIVARGRRGVFKKRSPGQMEDGPRPIS